MARDWSTLSGAELLALAVDRLQAEVPVELSGPVALERLRAVILSAERLQAVRLAAVRDVDARELYALDGSGSTRGWLRAQLGGDDGQLALARRLSKHRHVEDAHAHARIATRAAAQVCTALEAVPTEVDDAQLCAVLRDGLPGLLHQHSGGTAGGSDAGPALRAQQDEDEALLEQCCQDVLVPPAQRLEPAFVLLAQRLPAGLLAWALRMLVDPLLPDGNDQGDVDPYYLELRPLLDGDVDVRGHLDAETGQSLVAEIERRMRPRVVSDQDGPLPPTPPSPTPPLPTPLPPRSPPSTPRLLGPSTPTLSSPACSTGGTCPSTRDSQAPPGRSRKQTRWRRPCD